MIEAAASIPAAAPRSETEVVDMLARSIMPEALDRDEWRCVVRGLLASLRPGDDLGGGRVVARRGHVVDVTNAGGIGIADVVRLHATTARQLAEAAAPHGLCSLCGYALKVHPVIFEPVCQACGNVQGGCG